MKRVYLSLGSNLRDRAGNLRRAIAELTAAGISVARVSSFYRTEPVDCPPQPWFVNCVVEVSTDLMPLRLLSTLQSIERRLGRRRAPPKGPRLIDIDILLYENAVVHSPSLSIPHERMAERNFVLVPLAEIGPHLRHPVTQRMVSDMLTETVDRGQVRRLRDISQ